MPEGWRHGLADLAFVFGWQPSELAQLDVDDLIEWCAESAWIKKRERDRG